MANRIKGITIEIGGDTTKLDKALAGTNKEISQTQKALKDVERLLKMDPGNTELLAQRQRLLAQSVEATSDKLDTLKKAAESADKALARGNAYKEAYEPLKKELDGVSASMRGLEANAESMKQQLDAGNISTAQYDAFTQKLEETRKRANELEQAMESVNKEFAGAKIDQSQYDALQREIIETENNLKDLEDAADKSSVSLGKLEAAAGKISTGAGKVSDAFRPVTTAIAGIGAAALATVPATEEFRADLSMLDNNARMAGVGLDAARNAFTQLNTVSGETDSSIEAVSNLLQAGFAESNLQKAVEGLANAAIAFPDTLKIESLADSLQETLATGEATGQYGELLDRLGVGAETFAEGLSYCTSEVQKQDYALSFLTEGSLRGAYEGWRLNNEEMVANRDASMELQLALAELAESLLPIVTSVTQIAAQFINWFNSLGEGGQTAIIIIAGLVAAISPIAGIISAIGAASALSSISFGKWALIILGVAAALALLASIIAFITGKSNELDQAIGNTVNSVSGIANSGISTARTNYPQQTYSDIPGFASGALVPPNNPFLAVLGDNTQEPEVVAPYSTIKDAVGEAMAERGGSSSPVTIIVKATDGFTRNLSFSLSEESRRRGVSLVNR